MGEKIKLPFGIKIWKYRTTLPLLTMNSDISQGPYSTLSILEEISPIMEELKKKYSRSQYKVLFEEKNIPELTDIILMPQDKSYPLDLVHMITHGLKGDINRNIATGGHFLDPNKIRIIDLLGTDDRGVMKAKIEIRDPKSNKWILKKSSYNFIPQNMVTPKIYK